MELQRNTSQTSTVPADLYCHCLVTAAPGSYKFASDRMVRPAIRASPGRPYLPRQTALPKLIQPSAVFLTSIICSELACAGLKHGADETSDCRALGYLRVQSLAICPPISRLVSHCPYSLLNTRKRCSITEQIDIQQIGMGELDLLDRKGLTGEYRIINHVAFHPC